MGALSFLRYSLASVLRNRRRSLFAMIGIALALSLMTGSFVAVDSSSYGVLRAAISNVQVDFIGRDYNQIDHVDLDKINQAVSGIDSVKHVDRSSPMIVSYGFEIRNPVDNISYWGHWGSGSVAMIPHGDDWFLDRFSIHGDMPESGTAAIPLSMATELGLEAGEEILCQVKQTAGEYVNGTWVTTGSYYANLTYTISQTWTQDRTEDEYWYGGSATAGDVLIMNAQNPVVLNLEDGQGFFDGIAATVFPYANQVSSSLSYMIWLDRNDVISLADIPGSVDRLSFIQGRLAMQGNMYGFSVEESGLVYSLRQLAPELAMLKVLFLVLSLPVIALGVYLSLVGIDLGITARRREVGVLKSRGASNRQVFGSLMTESVVLGLFASVVGLALGIIVSRFLLGSALSFSSMSSEGDEWRWTDLRISGNTIGLAIFFGIALMFLSTYRPYKRVSRTPVAEALHHYSKTSTQTRYRAGVDFVLIGFSVLSVVSVLVGTGGIGNHGWSWITEVIVSVVLLLGIVIFPIMPFMLSVGVIRLLTRGSHKLYAKFTALVRPWTKELTYLVDKNIVRNPRRAANLGVIISLALAFGLFISVTMESSIAYEKETLLFEVGSDIKVTTFPGYMNQSGINYSALESVDHVIGVEHAAHYIFLSTMSSYFGGPYTVVLNSSEYLEAVDPGNSYFIGHKKSIMRDLEENGTCLMNENYAEQRSILEGDTLSFSMYWSYYENGTYYSFTHPVRVRVIGLVKTLPGLTEGQMFMDSSSMSDVSFKDLSAQGSGVGIIIKTASGADPRAVANQVTAVLDAKGLISRADVFQDRLDELKKDPTFGALADFLYMEYALSIVIMAVGVGLIVFVAVNDREHEIACIMARGSSASQMRKILMGESMTLMSLGLIVGATVGIVTAYLFNTLYGEGMNAIVERHMVFTYVSWIVVIASIVSLLVASLLATVKAGRIKLAEVLRIRGG